jgi:AcrR family transcriptional regulator
MIAKSKALKRRAPIRGVSAASKRKAGPKPPKQSFQIRRPTQERGRQKFEAILDAAERLLETRDQREISNYDLAEELQTSPPTIYHFFPEISLVFVALAERYLSWFLTVPMDIDGAVATWRELLDFQANQICKVFQTRKPVRKVLLGPGYSFEIRNRDFDNNLLIASRILEVFKNRFILPEVPELLDRVVEMIVINDAIWMLSIHRHGSITEASVIQASRARTAYMRTFLPEYLPIRQNDS